jgi:hypothetical protein
MGNREQPDLYEPALEHGLAHDPPNAIRRPMSHWMDFLGLSNLGGCAYAEIAQSRMSRNASTRLDIARSTSGVERTAREASLAAMGSDV